MRAFTGSLEPLRERPFRLLFFGRTLSAVGDAIVPVALTFAVLKLGNATDLGIVLGAGSATRVVFLLAGGVWADRLPRQLVMMGADAVRAAVQGLIALAFFTGRIQLWELAVGSAVFGGASAFFNPASTGLLPSIVSAERLQEANALIGLTRGVTEVAGPAIAGVVVAAFGYGLVFAIDAASFVASFVCLAAMRLPSAIQRGARSSMFAEAREGLREILDRPWMVAGCLCDLVTNFTLAILFVLAPVVVKEHFNGAKDWGFMLTFGAVGGLLGSAAALRYRPDRPLLVTYIIAFTFPLELAALAPPLPLVVLAAGLALVFWSVTLGNAYWATMLQQHIPREALSRVDSLTWIASLVVFPVGLVLAGPIAAAIGVRETLLGAAAVAALAVTAVLSIRDVRELRRVESATRTDAGSLSPESG
ncbi:MAG: MFS transporter [Gaiellaceae bacterium]